MVQGARAVAEGVVLDVRAEVGASLDQVRGALQQVVGQVVAARGDLDDGTDRLARAGSVLVAYLEQRDRLLEAERDRVLHDVLDAFAAGLSARERSALAGRVTDVVARRRDARDAERYRAAVGQPVSPTVALPEQVSTLAPPPALEPAAGAGAGGAGSEAGPARGGPAGTRAAAGARRTAARRAGGRPGAAARARPGGAAERRLAGLRAPPPQRRSAAPRRPDVRRACGERPAARRWCLRPAGRPARQRPRVPLAAARRPARTVAAPGRGRLAAMPSAPRVDVALDAASRPATGTRQTPRSGDGC